MRFARFFTAMSLTALACLQTLVATAAAQDQQHFVKTDSGVLLKVVVRQDTAIYETADRGSANRPVKMFKFFYVLKPDQADETGKTQNGFYRVASGTSLAQHEGYLHSDDVVEWSHRQALGLRPLQGRQLAHFFDSRETLQTAYHGSQNRPDPLSREPQGGGGINLVPILERFTIDVEGDEIEAYRVAYLHSRAAGGGGGDPSGRPEPGSVDLSKTSLDVVFVIDTTHSMQPFIEATKDVIARVSNELAQAAGGGETVPVRFGLVGYRDVISNPGEDWYVTRLICDLDAGADHGEFERLLRATREADQSSEDHEEDVFAGLKLAAQGVKWNPNAFKHIVLIGDAPPHTTTDGRKNSQRLTLDAVRALVQPSGREKVREKIALHAFQIVRDADSGPPPTDHFKKLASGEVTGLYREFDGLSGSPEFVQELVSTILKSREGLASALAGQAPAQDTPGLGLLLELVSAGANEADPNVPHFASGFAAEIDFDGNQTMEPFVLVQYGKLDLFNSALGFSVRALKQSGDAGARDVNKVVNTMQILATQINLGEPVNPDMPLSKLLNVILGFPVRSNIFDMSFAKLAAMPEADFQAWVQQVESSSQIIQSHLDNSKLWFSLGADVPLDKQFCFVRVKDLP